MRRSQQHVVGNFVRESRPEPGLIRRVFQQSPHEISHAGNHLSHRHIFPDAHAAIFQGRLELIGHAVEFLGFQGRLGQTVFFQQRQGVCDRADVVRSQGQFYAALTGARGMASTNCSAMRSKQASVSCLAVQTGTGQTIFSALMTS